KVAKEAVTEGSALDRLSVGLSPFPLEDSSPRAPPASFLKSPGKALILGRCARLRRGAASPTSALGRMRPALERPFVHFRRRVSLEGGQHEDTKDRAAFLGLETAGAPRRGPLCGGFRVGGGRRPVNAAPPGGRRWRGPSGRLRTGCSGTL